ncbi:hypothetical protein JQK87_01715 [Streptomyces sp. G44]|uniref:DUF6302 family protein n=1 Tax=Streptomyces sp. G44 TaxID=2807632 RepID=UPI00195FF683|nr:DUF6302 family protein [Streptomyces sp. G44]MBM7167159.1 hypothetical protein [Streptomyces sp. G44]
MSPWEAYDFDYYVQRIAEPELLKKSWAVRMMRMPLTAVPVGGTRRGGDYPVPCPHFALAVRDALQDRPGYPHLRMRRSTRTDEIYVVEWGEKPPALWPDANDADVGRFYGYSEAAIDQYTARRTQVLTVPPASCSVFSPERPPA